MPATERSALLPDTTSTQTTDRSTTSATTTSATTTSATTSHGDDTANMTAPNATGPAGPAPAAHASGADHDHDIESASSSSINETGTSAPSPASPSLLSRRFLLGPISKSHGDLILLAHSFSSGMVDAASFSNWAAFVAMQTGNTVLLALATASTPTNPHAWLTTLVSIISYLLGSFLTFRAATWISPPGGAGANRAFLFALWMGQALLILIPAALVAGNVVPHNAPGLVTQAGVEEVVHNIRIVALLPPLAFQAGMQIATSRLMGYNELPVNVITSTYCDIMGDNALFSAHNEKRNRRLASVLLLFAGAVVSAWLLRSPGGMAAALFVGGGVKFIAALAGLLFLKPAKEGRGK